MGRSAGTRGARVAWAALAALFTVFVAIPALLGAPSQSLRISMTAPAVTTSTTTTTRPVPKPALAPIPPERAGDRAISPTDGELTQLAPPTTRTSNTAATRAPWAAPSAAGAPGVYALVVGINDYPGTDRDLRSAVADADVMVKALNRFNVPPSNILELLDGQATGSAIANGVDWLVNVAGPDSTAVFFYSGHGRKVTSSTEAIVGSDGVAIADYALASMFAPLQARDAWFVIAACYGGGFDELVEPGRIVTAAADRNSIAWENDSFGQSYLGEYLVRRGLLEGKAGGPTVQQAFSWAQASIQKDAPDRTLTQFDASTAPISLDGVARTTVPPTAPVERDYPAAGPGPAPPAGPQPPPSSQPPTQPAPTSPPPTSPPPTTSSPPTTAPPPPPCGNILGLGC